MFSVREKPILAGEKEVPKKVYDAPLTKAYSIVFAVLRSFVQNRLTLFVRVMWRLMGPDGHF